MASDQSSSQQPSKENARRSLLGASFIVSAMTMLSRVAGLLRDVVLARLFGAGDSADAFFVAFRIPQFLRRLFAEGAFAQAFVPVFNEYKNQKDARGEVAALKSLINAVAGALSGVLFVVTLLIVLAAPLVAQLFAPGFVSQPEKFTLVVDMLRITFPYLMLISLTGMAAGILNSYGRFWVPAFTPVLLNVCLIAAALWVSPQMSEPVFALAWAVLIAGFAQLIFQLPFLARINLLPVPVWDWQHPGVKKILALMLPAIFGVSVSQINLLLDTVLASFLPGGSVSWLYYSDRLVELPLGVFGIAIATVLLPSLSSIRFADGQTEFTKATARQFLAALDWSLRCIFLLALPASAALILLAEPILYLLFQYEAMQPRDVMMAAAALKAYALGLLWFMAIKVLASAYYSQQDTRTPVRIGIIAMFANMVFNLIFVWLTHSYWQMGHVGLALATSLSALLNAVLLFRGLRKNQQLVEHSLRSNALLQSGTMVVAFKVVLATVVMSLLLSQLLPGSEWWPGASFMARLQQVAVLVAVGALSYFVVLGVSGLRIRHFRYLDTTT